MKAIGYRVPGNIDREDSFVDIELPQPKPAGRDILVEVKAVSVNPVDYKVRQGTAPLNEEWKVVGAAHRHLVMARIQSGPTYCLERRYPLRHLVVEVRHNLGRSIY